MFYVLLGFIATAVAILMYNHDAGEVFGYPIETVASVTLSASLLLYLVSGRMTEGTNILKSLKQGAIWLLIGFALVLGYSFKDDAQILVNRVKGELVPGSAIMTDNGDISFRRSDNGHFMVQAIVNGTSVPMLVDTGASSVVLTYEDAKRAGLSPENMTFSSPVNTANGRTLAARIWLSRITVGGIGEQRILAMVAQEGALRESLLGMSYLDRLGSWSVSGDKLTMTP